MTLSAKESAMNLGKPFARNKAAVKHTPFETAVFYSPIK
jgi:hypothetical protein